MLEKLRHHYRRAKTITLILDNYIIHKSKQTERWLKKNPSSAWCSSQFTALGLIT